jgi:xanthine/uracil permease
MMIRLQEIKGWLKKRNNLIVLSGIIIGTAGGFMYYYFIGCRTGSCPITSSPWLSMLWGATVGYLIFDMFRKKNTPIIKDEDNRA